MIDVNVILYVLLFLANSDGVIGYCEVTIITDAVLRYAWEYSTLFSSWIALSNNELSRMRILFLLFFFVSILCSCTFDNRITVRGELYMTKDGYYLGEYVVPLEEIRQYMPDGNTDGLNGVTAEATGHVKNIQMLCETATGEKLQCREGTTKYLYNLTQFTITD